MDHTPAAQGIPPGRTEQLHARAAITHEKKSYFDVFNGDADGICALHQLRLAYPRKATLVTGVKRDIKLLERIAGEKDAGITVCDISMDQNWQALENLLVTCEVLYIDHHYAGDMPLSAHLEAHIDPSPDVCTSLIVDRLLGGRLRSWAVVAAFGDNLHEAARVAAASLGLAEREVAVLRELGELMNYNGYGARVEDLHIAPDALFKAITPHEDPFAFYAKSEALGRLREGYLDDMKLASTIEPFFLSGIGRIFRMPAEAWSRRVAGVFSNERARECPELAHGLMVDNGDGTMLVSVRAPLTKKIGADTLCRKFPTGGGRAAAAGINALPAGMTADFIRAFEEIFTP